MKHSSSNLIESTVGIPSHSPMKSISRQNSKSLKSTKVYIHLSQSSIIQISRDIYQIHSMCTSLTALANLSNSHKNSSRCLEKLKYQSNDFYHLKVVKIFFSYKCVDLYPGRKEFYFLLLPIFTSFNLISFFS